MIPRPPTGPPATTLFPSSVHDHPLHTQQHRVGPHLYRIPNCTPSNTGWALICTGYPTAHPATQGGPPFVQDTQLHTQQHRVGPHFYRIPNCTPSNTGWAPIFTGYPTAHPATQGGPPFVQNTQICCGFFWTCFCFSDRR
jgi:hypothetical protein